MTKTITIIILLFSVISFGQKREFRGAWVATVKNIDWPSSCESSVEVQKKELVDLLNVLQDIGINAILFQVRAECDAFYDSKSEPWSNWLTGKQGRAPDPYFDPLEFITKEAHKRSMELHAWLNPFRAVADTAGYTPDSMHISNTRPDWIIKSGKYKFLNPGLEEVRQYTNSIVMDVVRRYEVDGIHFDDYFYPYTGMTDEDLPVFKKYPRGFNNIEDWRRDNVNLFVSAVYNSIKSIKPFIKFGISPFGIWKDGVPAGITGLSSYHKIYCDALYWLENEIVDYIAPQLYWKIGGPQDYVKLSDWWAENLNEKHMYAGHALYKMINRNNSWNADEIANQIRLNHNSSNIHGSVFFRSIDIVNNVKGIGDTLKTNVYKHKTLIPKMTWIDSIPPLFPYNLSAFACGDGTYLHWQNPVSAIDRDEAKYIVLYRFDLDEIEINDPKNIIEIIPAYQNSYIDTLGIQGTEYKYLVTALDKMQNESAISNIVNIKFSQIELYPGEKPIEAKLINVDSISAQGHVRIRFSICNKEWVRLTVFDDSGNKVAVIVDEELLPGNYGARFKPTNKNTTKYHCNISTPTFSDMKSFSNLKVRIN